MRNKILAELEKKFSGLSKKLLGLIADKLAKKVTEESGIEQAITDYDNAVSITDLATDFQKEGDRRVTDAKKEWDKTNPKKPEKTEEEEEEEETPTPKPKAKKKNSDEPPAWAKGLIETVTSLQKEKTEVTIKSRVAAKLKDKVPEKFYSKWALPEKEDGLDDFIKEIEDDWNEIKQDGVNTELGKSSKPEGGGETSTVKPTGKEEADIKAWADKTKPKETAKV